LAAAAIASVLQANELVSIDSMRDAFLLHSSYYVTHGTYDPFHVEGYGIIDSLAALTSILPVIAVPDAYSVSRGASSMGGVLELADSDDQYLAFVPEFLDFRYQLEFTVDATSPAESPSGLEFGYESKAVNVFGTVEQRIELFDFDSAQFETVDTRLTSPTDSVVRVTPGGDSSRFVQFGTNAMQARISYENSLPFWVFNIRNRSLPYRVRADHVFWRLTP
jgi:hypothetical protein